MLRKLLMFGGFAMAMAFMGGTAKADTITVEGISYTYALVSTDTITNSYVVQLTMATSGATSLETLSTFSVQFTGASSVTLASASSNAGTWGQPVEDETNTASGCQVTGGANWWCLAGSGLAVPGGTYTFTFDVTGPVDSYPGIKAFQSTPLAISTTIGVPEPSTTLLLGIGLIGLAGLVFLKRRPTPAPKR